MKGTGVGYIRYTPTRHRLIFAIYEDFVSYTRDKEFFKRIPVIEVNGGDALIPEGEHFFTDDKLLLKAIK